MAIIRIYTGPDGLSHFQDVEPKYEPRGDQSEGAELIPGSGVVIRRFEARRTNPWHHAPGRYAVFTLSGAVDIEIGDGTVRRLPRGHPDRRGPHGPRPRDARGRHRATRVRLRAARHTAMKRSTEWVRCFACTGSVTYRGHLWGTR